jgi:hypothetical protein
MVDVPTALGHHVVKGSPPGPNQMGDRPDHREGHEEGQRSQEHALVARVFEVMRVEPTGRLGFPACRVMIEPRQQAGEDGEPDDAK